MTYNTYVPVELHPFEFLPFHRKNMRCKLIKNATSSKKRIHEIMTNHNLKMSWRTCNNIIFHPFNQFKARVIRTKLSLNKLLTSSASRSVYKLHLTILLSLIWQNSRKSDNTVCNHLITPNPNLYCALWR